MSRFDLLLPFFSSSSIWVMAGSLFCSKGNSPGSYTYTMAVEENKIVQASLVPFRQLPARAESRLLLTFDCRRASVVAHTRGVASPCLVCRWFGCCSSAARW